MKKEKNENIPSEIPLLPIKTIIMIEWHVGGENAMSANRAHKWQKVCAREQKCVPRSTGMGKKKAWLSPIWDQIPLHVRNHPHTLHSKSFDSPTHCNILMPSLSFVQISCFRYKNAIWQLFCLDKDRTDEDFFSSSEAKGVQRRCLP